MTAVGVSHKEVAAAVEEDKGEEEEVVPPLKNAPRSLGFQAVIRQVRPLHLPGRAAWSGAGQGICPAA